MKIGLIDVDGHNFPNLALMKISAWHKAQGDDVEWCFPMSHYDVVYQSKVFDDTYSPDIDWRPQADKIIKAIQNVIALINSQEQKIKELTEENERQIEELARSYKALDESMNFYCSFTKSKIQNCPIDDEVAKAKADTVRKMQERILQLFPSDKKFTTISRFTIDQIAKEMLDEK